MEFARRILGRSNLFEMAILDRVDLGFSFFAYVSSKQGGHEWPRVKFAATKRGLKIKKESFSISFEAEPRLKKGNPPSEEILNAALAWVEMNQTVLTTFWNDSSAYTTRELFAALKPNS